LTWNSYSEDPAGFPCNETHGQPYEVTLGKAFEEWVYVINNITGSPPLSGATVKIYYTNGTLLGTAPESATAGNYTKNFTGIAPGTCYVEVRKYGYITINTLDLFGTAFDCNETHGQPYILTMNEINKILINVTDNSSSPVSNAEVKIINQGTGDITTRHTNASGLVEVSGLEDGYYTVTATIFGYTEAQVTDVLYTKEGAYNDYVGLIISPIQTIDVYVNDTSVPCCKPAGNARVDIIRESDGVIVWTQYTNASGWTIFAYPDVPEGNYYVRASKEGYVNDTQGPISYSQTEGWTIINTICMLPTIEGYVTEQDNVTVIPNADVELCHISGAPCYNTPADGSGYFKFSDIPTGQYELTASKYGFITNTLGDDEPPIDFVAVSCTSHEANISLGPAPSIEGYVFDCNDSSPVEGVDVHLDKDCNGVYENITTDGNGYYVFPNYEAGDYCLVYSKYGYMDYERICDAADCNGIDTREFNVSSFSRLPTIEGFVFDQLNKSISGAEVRLDMGCDGSYQTVHSNPDGSFIFVVDEADIAYYSGSTGYCIDAYKEGYTFISEGKTITPFVVGEACQVRWVNLTMDVPATIYGYVTEEDNETGIEGAEVCLTTYCDDECVCQPCAYTAKPTDVAGFYVFDDPIPAYDQYYVHASAYAYVSNCGKLDWFFDGTFAIRKDIALAELPFTYIEGHVFDAETNASIHGARVDLYGNCTDLVNTTYTDGSGHYAFINPPDGYYCVNVSADTYMPLGVDFKEEPGFGYFNGSYHFIFDFFLQPIPFGIIDYDIIPDSVHVGCDSESKSVGIQSVVKVPEEANVTDVDVTADILFPNGTVYTVNLAHNSTEDYWWATYALGTSPLRGIYNVTITATLPGWDTSQVNTSFNVTNDTYGPDIDIDPSPSSVQKGKSIKVTITIKDQNDVGSYDISTSPQVSSIDGINLEYDGFIDGYHVYSGSAEISPRVDDYTINVSAEDTCGNVGNESGTFRITPGKAAIQPERGMGGGGGGAAGGGTPLVGPIALIVEPQEDMVAGEKAVIYIRNNLNNLGVDGVKVTITQDGAVLDCEGGCITDLEGKVVFTPISDGVIDIKAEKDGFRSALETNIPIYPKETLNLGITPREPETGGTVTITVRDRNGNLLQGARVKVTIDGETKTYTTDSKGTVTVDIPESDRDLTITAIATKEGIESNEDKVTANAPIIPAPGELVIRAPADIGAGQNFSIMVEDSMGRSIEGAIVTVKLPDGTTKILITDENGETPRTIISSQEGSISVTAEKEGYTSDTDEVHVFIREGPPPGPFIDPLKRYWLFILIALLLILLLAFLYLTSGKVTVTKKVDGKVITVTVMNGTGRPLNACVLEDAFPVGAEVTLVTDGIIRQDNKLIYNFGNMKPKTEVKIKYECSEVGVVPPARVMWTDREVISD